MAEMANNIWDYVVDGLFVEYLVALLGAIAATTNSFSGLLFSIFGVTAETKISEAANYTWSDNLKNVLTESAIMLEEVAKTEGTVFPIGQYIITFVLFIGAVLGIVSMAMTSIRYARAVPIRSSTTTFGGGA